MTAEHQLERIHAAGLKVDVAYEAFGVERWQVLLRPKDEAKPLPNSGGGATLAEALADALANNTNDDTQPTLKGVFD